MTIFRIRLVCIVNRQVPKCVYLGKNCYNILVKSYLFWTLLSLTWKNLKLYRKQLRIFWVLMFVVYPFPAIFSSWHCHIFKMFCLIYLVAHERFSISSFALFFYFVLFLQLQKTMVARWYCLLLSFCYPCQYCRGQVCKIIKLKPKPLSHLSLELLPVWLPTVAQW